MPTLSRIRLSRRVEALAPSATLAAGARARELRRQGVEVLSLAAGEPDFDTPEPIKQAAWRALQAGMTGYGPVPGDEASREAIAEKLERENGILDVTPEHVVVSAGGKQSLALLFQALLDPPTAEAPALEVVLPVPAWVSYRPQIELAGGIVSEGETTAESAFKMTPEQLRSALHERSRALVLNSPSNPCGTMYTPDELRALAGVIAEASGTVCPQLIVITDEIYEKLVFGDVEHLSLGSLPEIAERVVTVNGLSKCLAMTGWRIGYAAGSGETGLAIAGALKKLQSQSTTSIPTFLMPAIVTALRECDAEIERFRSIFAERATVMHEGLREVPGFVTPRPTGAMYAFPDVAAHFGTTSAGGRRIETATNFAAALLDEHHVAVVPGEAFGGSGARCCRFSFACRDDVIREAVERVGAFVAGLS